MLHVKLVISLFATGLLVGGVAIIVSMRPSTTAGVYIVGFLLTIFAVSVATLLLAGGGVPKTVEVIPDGVLAKFIGLSRRYRAEDMNSVEILGNSSSTAIVFHLRNGHRTGLSDVEREIASVVLKHLRELNVPEQKEGRLLGMFGNRRDLN